MKPDHAYLLALSWVSTGAHQRQQLGFPLTDCHLRSHRRHPGRPTQVLLLRDLPPCFLWVAVYAAAYSLHACAWLACPRIAASSDLELDLLQTPAAVQGIDPHLLSDRHFLYSGNTKIYLSAHSKMWFITGKIATSKKKNNSCAHLSALRTVEFPEWERVVSANLL